MNLLSQFIGPQVKWARVHVFFASKEARSRVLVGPLNPFCRTQRFQRLYLGLSNGSAGDASLARLQNRGGDPDRATVLVFKTISNMADRYLYRHYSCRRNKDLYPHAAKIIPEWYAKERDLKNLSIPKPK